MLRVTVELCPGGDESSPQQIAAMKVWRETQNAQEVNSYSFRRTSNGETSNGETVIGEGVEHRYALNVWTLIRAVLNHSEPHPGYCQSCHRENPEVG